MSLTNPIIIGGDGIAGRSMALALARRGFSVVIIGEGDSIAAGKSLAAGGFQLSPNGWRALAALGIADELTPHIKPLSMLRILSLNNGQTLSHFCPDGFYASVMRQGLLDCLHTALSETGLVAWHKASVINIAAGGGHCQIDCDDGAAFRPPWFIGADGASGISRSYVMASYSDSDTMIGEAASPKPHKFAYRAIVPPSVLNENLTAAATTLWLGDGAHFVFYPLVDGSLNGIAITLAQADFDVRGLLSSNSLLSPLADYFDVPPQPLYRRPPLATYQRGRVILTGDAAHAMAPHLAQGINQTLVDGSLMLSLLQQNDTADLGAIFSQWSATRARSLRQVIASSERIGDILGLRGSLSVLRNLGLSYFGNRIINRRLGDLWGIHK